MERDERRRREEELDRFWEIDALLPRRVAPHLPADTEAVEVELEPLAQNAERTENTIRIPPRTEAPKPHFIPPHTADEAAKRPAPLLDYTPDNALIRRVRIYSWKSDYRYYEGFVRDAERLYPVTGREVPRTPFFSYVPQYAQMNRPQLEWYLWWRECVRRGEYHETDYSYVLLYVYELINLSDKIEPAAAQEKLVALWLRYREIYHQLDSYLPEWICDYSLIHQLPAPASLCGETLSAVMSHCRLKEFYVPTGGEDGYLQALMAFCSNYDYRKSKFYNEQNRTLFDSAVLGGLSLVVEHLSREGKLFSAAGMEDSRLTRDAYTGALCSYHIKRRIEVEFCSFSRSHELRFFITDVLKYIENRLRATLGVRSRLSIYALPTSTRQLLDAYLDKTLPAKASAKKPVEEAPAAYEKLYDLPRQELSLSHAADIERVSWETTEQLVEAFEEPIEEIPKEPEVISTPPAPTPEAVTDMGSPWRPYRAFLRALLSEDSVAAASVARERGTPLEVLADDVNTLAFEELGDILLEEGDSGFAVIEDYREELEKILQALDGEAS